MRIDIVLSAITLVWAVSTLIYHFSTTQAVFQKYSCSTLLVSEALESLGRGEYCCNTSLVMHNPDGTRVEKHVKGLSGPVRGVGYIILENGTLVEIRVWGRCVPG